MTGKRWFWPAIALQILILFGMIGIHSYTLATGLPVLLKTAPVDPWDPFRGEYVRLNYDISRIDVESIPVEGDPYQRGERVWVTLQDGDPFWTAVGVSDRRPQVGPGQMAVKATVEWMNEGFDIPQEKMVEPSPLNPPDRGNPGERPGPPLRRQPAQLFVTYGIEQFYVPEGEGRGLEQQITEMTVEALVDRFGRIALHKVFLEGKEINWR